MILEERLVNIITANAAFIATGAGLFALEAPQDGNPPYVVYQLIANEGAHMATHSDVYMRTVMRRYQFSVVTVKLAQAEAIVTALLSALCDTPDPSGQIQAAVPEGETVTKDPELQRFKRTIDFLIIGDRN